MAITRAVFGWFFSSYTTPVGNFVSNAKQYADDKYQAAAALVVTSPEEKAKSQSDKYHDKVDSIKTRHEQRKAEMRAQEEVGDDEDQQKCEILKEYLSNAATMLTTQIKELTEARLGYFYRSEIQSKTLLRNTLQTISIAKTYSEMVLMAARAVDMINVQKMQSPYKQVLMQIKQDLTVENCRNLCQGEKLVINSQNAL